MKSIPMLILALFVAMSSKAMENPAAPKLNQIFDYESSKISELDKIFDSLALEFSSFKGDVNDFIEFLRRQAHDADAIKALILYLQNSESFVLLRNNIQRVIDEIPEDIIAGGNIDFFAGEKAADVKSEKTPVIFTDEEIELKAVKILVVVLGSPEILSYFAPILRKYEDYIEIFSTHKIAHYKALSLFCLNIISPVIIDINSGKKKNLKKLASYIQKAANECSAQGGQRSYAGQHVIDTLKLLDKKFQSSFCFSKDFHVDLCSVLIKLPQQNKNGNIIIEKKILVNWLENTYLLDKHLSNIVLCRLVVHDILLKRPKKIGESTKYIIKSHTKIS